MKCDPEALSNSAKTSQAIEEEQMMNGMKNLWALVQVVGLLLLFVFPIGTVVGIILIILGSVKYSAIDKDAKAHKLCPHCKEKIKSDATVCKHCSSPIEEE